MANLACLGLPTPPWVHAFAYELEAARDAFTSHVHTPVRPQMEAVSKNKNFFAAEAIGSIVMQLFLLEVRRRCVAPSILWLHDGFWIDKSVEDEILLAAEWHVRKTVFPASGSGDPLFRIVDLTEARALVLTSCPRPPFPPLFAPCSRPIRLSRPGFSKKYPVAKFLHKRGSKRKLATYFERTGKRARQLWL